MEPLEGLSREGQDQIYVFKDPSKKKKKNVCVFAHFAKRNARRKNRRTKENGYSLGAESENREESGGLGERFL